MTIVLDEQVHVMLLCGVDSFNVRSFSARASQLAEWGNMGVKVTSEFGVQKTSEVDLRRPRS
jgi:uncharacterized protein (DUF934 family)